MECRIPNADVFGRECIECCAGIVS
jgi:hypothetical protein